MHNLETFHLTFWTLNRALFITQSLAPEHKFPAGLDDCHEALTWIANKKSFFGAESNAPVFLWGCSQGATFALALAIREAKAGRNDTIQKVVWHQGVGDVDLIGKTPSWKRTEGKFTMLNVDYTESFVTLHMADQRESPEGNVLKYEELPSGLPPVHFIRTFYDPLDSDAELVSEKLSKAGVKVTEDHLGNLPHVWFTVSPACVIFASTHSCSSLFHHSFLLSSDSHSPTSLLSSIQVR